MQIYYIILVSALNMSMKPIGSRIALAVCHISTIGIASSCPRENTLKHHNQHQCQYMIVWISTLVMTVVLC